MRWPLVAGFALVLTASFGRADQITDPLRFAPKDSDLVLRVDSPRKLVEAVLATEELQQLGQFSAIREAFQSTNFRRASRLLAYYEKELGASWPVLLDKLAGGGVALTTKFTRDNSAATLLVIQSKDEELLKHALKLLLNVIEQELTRQDAKDRPKTEKYREIETIRIGNDFHMTRAGSALLVSNKSAGIERGLDLFLDGPKGSLSDVSGPADARKLLPTDPLVSMWVNLKPAQESPEGKEIFKRPKSDAFQLITAGGLLDVIGQSPFLAIGAQRRADGTWLASFRMPRGRDATPEGQGLHLAPEGQPGFLPPLEPANTLFSTSFYLDIGKFWTERELLLAEGTRKGLVDAEKNLGRFLAGRKLSELLTQSGQYHRFVAVAQDKSGYEKYPTQLIPAFAYNSNMRDPAFGQAMDGILRLTALVTGAQAKLKLVEETIDGVTLVGYRFPEDGSLPIDASNFRFNFSPCFATVGDQFFVASTIDLGRELITTLKKPVQELPSTYVGAKSRLYATGGAAFLKVFEEQLYTQAALAQSKTVDEVRQEVGKFVTWLGTLGTLEMDTEYLPHEFRFEIKWMSRGGPGAQPRKTEK